MNLMDCKLRSICNFEFCAYKCSYLYGYFFHMRSVWDQNFMCVCVWRLKLSQTFLSGSCVDPNVFLSVCLYVGSRWVKTVPSRLSFLFLCMCECVFVFVCVGGGGGLAWLVYWLQSCSFDPKHFRGLWTGIQLFSNFWSSFKIAMWAFQNCYVFWNCSV